MAVRADLETALRAASKAIGVTDVPDLELGRAKNPDHGDYASSAGLKLARGLRQPPNQIAKSSRYRTERRRRRLSAVT